MSTDNGRWGDHLSTETPLFTHWRHLSSLLSTGVDPATPALGMHHSPVPPFTDCVLSRYPPLSEEVQVPVRPPSDTYRESCKRIRHSVSRGNVFSVLLKMLHYIAGLTDTWLVPVWGGKGILPVCWESCCALWTKVLFSKPSNKYLVFVERHFREYTVVKFIFC